FFENFLNVSAIRDSIRQSALDFSRVATLIQARPDLSALAGAYGGVTPKLDPTRAAYMGQSFGTLVGADLSAIEPSVDLFILDVIMSNQGTVALARAYGMAVLKPDLDPPEHMAQLPSPASANVDGQTAILVQYAPATHGFNWSAQHGQLDYEPGFPHDGDNP